MKIAICYYSRHHGNTLKLLQEMTKGFDVDFIDVTAKTMVRLEHYDVIGFASGIYFWKFHETVLSFISQYLPEGKKVFFVCTYGIRIKNYMKDAGAALKGKKAQVIGGFGCRGFDTYGFLKLFGGIAKGRPNERDFEKARAFFGKMIKKEQG